MENKKTRPRLSSQHPIDFATHVREIENLNAERQALEENFDVIRVLKERSDRFHFVVVDEMFSKVDDQYAEYALELFKQFGLQLLIVAPLDAKARVTQPYVGCYLHVVKKENRSAIFEMSAREFENSVARNAEMTHVNDFSES